MHLSNFGPVTDPSAHGHLIALNAYGLDWDLHDFADFQGFTYSLTPSGPTLTLNWRLGERIIRWRDAGRQYGIPDYPSDAFCLVFSNVFSLSVGPRDDAIPNEEDLGISSVSFIAADEPLMAHTHMVFRFNGGQMIQVGAEKAEFVLQQPIRSC